MSMPILKELFEIIGQYWGSVPYKDFMGKRCCAPLATVRIRDSASRTRPLFFDHPKKRGEKEA